MCNAGPLIALGKVGQLGLLSRIFDEILVAREVYREVVIDGRHVQAAEAHAVDFLVGERIIQVVDVEIPSQSPLLNTGIDAGEVETIVLAQLEKVDWILIDDKQARHNARLAGLQIKGTVGLLLEAWRRDILSLQELELLINQIKSLPELWISEALCDAILTQARREIQS